MGETITVCESICRDFSLIWFADPKVWQAGFTLLAAIVASGSALWIAYKVYPVQKEKDRQLQIRAKRRQAYLSSISGWIDLTREMAGWDGADPRKSGDFIRSIDLLTTRIALVSPTSLFELFRELQVAIYGALGEFQSQVRHEGEGSEDGLVPIERVSELWRQVWFERSKERHDTLGKVLEEMSAEFSVPKEFEITAGERSR